MTWIPYNQAIHKNITGRPEKGDAVLYRARGGKYPIWYKAEVERVIDYRRYVVRYEVPEEVKSHFINGTTSAIAKIDDLSFFYSVIEEPGEEKESEE